MINCLLLSRFRKSFTVIFLSAFLALSTSLTSPPDAASQCPPPAYPEVQEPSFKSLPSSAIIGEDKGSGLTTYGFTYRGAKVVVLRVKADSALRLRPGFSSTTAPTSTLAAAHKAVAAVNGGYFNLSDGESASYCYKDGNLVLDPTKNKALTGNVKLKPFLPDIFNRSELRIYKDKSGKRSYAIARHLDKTPDGLTLVHSLQGGPQLLPELTAKQEAFLREEKDGKQVDSIGVNRTAARTAVAFTRCGDLLIVSAAGKGQDEFSSGLKLSDLADLLRGLSAVQALNFDGGTSTTLVRARCRKGSQDVMPDYDMLIGREPETLVRSILYLSR